MKELRGGITWSRACELSGFSVDVVEVAPGARETLIVHDECDEAWYVLAGELVALVDGQCAIAYPGDWVRVPRGTPHGSRNETSAPVRLLVVNAPPWDPSHDHPVELGTSD